MFSRTFLLLFGTATLPACLIDQATYDDRLRELTEGGSDSGGGDVDLDGDGFLSVDDCDDSDADVYPDAPEVCDGVDQDCDGEVDEDATDATTWYADADGDGYGAGGDTSSACERPSTHVADATDCDDTDASVHPDAEDIPYDRIDQDCVGGDPEDLDGDGYVAVEAHEGDDCDDTDAGVHPDAEETWADGFTDNDCDGEVESVQYDYGRVMWAGSRESEGLGRTIAAGGDLDGDGLADVFVGTEYDSTVGTDAGALYRTDGTPGGTLDAAPVLLPPDAGALFAGEVDAGVDIDEDGVHDLIVTAAGLAPGAAWLVSGAAWNEAPTSVVTDVSLGEVVADAAGTFGPSAVQFVGDVNGDGLQDVALGECCSAAGGTGTVGRVSIFTASAFGGTLADADVIVDGPWDGAYFGFAIDRAGDQDNDGLDDLLVSSSGGLLGSVVPGHTSGQALDVAITVIWGEPTAGEERVAAAGDIDGDGTIDAAVVGGTESVLFFTVLAGAPAWDLSVPRFRMNWDEHGAVPTVVPLGDRDGDGRSDTALFQAWSDSGTQRGWMMPGSDSSSGATVQAEDLSLSFLSLIPTALLGYSAALAGDVDGDGIDDIAVGGPDYSGTADDAGGVTLLPVPY